MTVRQLEALVRIAESLAKMRLEATVQSRDVHEALRLFKVSTMAAASAAPQTVGVEMRFLGDEERLQIQNAEQFLKQRVPVGTDAKMLLVLDEGVALGHADFALRRAQNHEQSHGIYRVGQRSTSSPTEVTKEFWPERVMAIITGPNPSWTLLSTVGSSSWNYNTSCRQTTSGNSFFMTRKPGLFWKVFDALRVEKRDFNLAY